jgi:hypothetical protein
LFALYSIVDTQIIYKHQAGWHLCFQAVEFILQEVDPNYFMKKILLVALLSTLIQGCTSISQPTASRPLVEHKFVTSIASVKLSLGTALSNLTVGTTLIVEQIPAVMGEHFFAATGLSCRKLTLQQRGQNVYCLNAQGLWFKVKQVISEYNENNMSEVGL